MFLIPASHTMSWTSVYSSSGLLSIRSNPLNLSHFHCITVRDLFQVVTVWSNGFLHFLQFKSEFGNKELMIWATVSSWSCFCWLYRSSPSLAAKNIINLISVLTIWWSSIKWSRAKANRVLPREWQTEQTHSSTWNDSVHGHHQTVIYKQSNLNIRELEKQEQTNSKLVEKINIKIE